MDWGDSGVTGPGLEHADQAEGAADKARVWANCSKACEQGERAGCRYLLLTASQGPQLRRGRVK